MKVPSRLKNFLRFLTLAFTAGGLYLFQKAHELGWMGAWLVLGLLGILAALFFDRIFPGLLRRASIRRAVYGSLGKVLGEPWRCQDCSASNRFGVNRCWQCERPAPDQSWTCGVCSRANSLSDPICAECSVRRPFDDGSY